MNIKVLRSSVADGRDVSKGKTYKVSDSAGRTLVRLGKAIEVKPKESKGGNEDPSKD